MLHVILKAGRLLRPEGVAEFRTAVESITTVKPFTRTRKGHMERVKGFTRVGKKAKDLRDKANKLRELANRTTDQGKIKRYYNRAEKLVVQANELEVQEKLKGYEPIASIYGELEEGDKIRVKGPFGLPDRIGTLLEKPKYHSNPSMGWYDAKVKWEDGMEENAMINKRNYTFYREAGKPKPGFSERESHREQLEEIKKWKRQ